MIAVDTNILVRLFVGDDPAQLRAAQRLLSDDRPDGSVYVVGIVLAELVWALRSAYQWPQSRIVEAIDVLLTDTRFTVEARESVETALASWKDGTADFADFLIATLARDRGCTTTYTFDRAAGRAAHAFTLLE